MKLLLLKFCAGTALLAMLAPHAAAADAGQEPAGDPAMGAKLFLQCRACHSVAPTQAQSVGPNLSGVAGASAGSQAGYTYSPALAKAGLTWTPENLDRFLTKPSAFVPGTKMVFAGVASAKNRQDIIAYLATLKADH